MLKNAFAILTTFQATVGDNIFCSALFPICKITNEQPRNAAVHKVDKGPKRSRAGRGFPHV
jgi:hypothetical protein